MHDDEKKPRDSDDDLLDDEDDFDFDDIDDFDDVLGEDDAEVTAPPQEKETPPPPQEDSDTEIADDDGDLADESWDDFDEDGEESEQQAELPPEKQKKQKKVKLPKAGSSGDIKSLVSKHFNLIVIAIAVIGGGGFVLSNMGGNAPQPEQAPVETAQQVETAPPVETASEQTAEQQAPAEKKEAPSLGFLVNPEQLDEQLQGAQPQAKPERAPPMPSPMSTEVEQAPAPPGNEVLTPMPEKISDLDDRTQLASLNEPLDSEMGAVIENEKTVMEVEVAAAEKQQAEEPAGLLGGLLGGTIKAEEEIEHEPAEPPVITKEMEPESEPANIEMQTGSNENVKALEAKLLETQEDLANKIAKTDKKISGLTDMIARLEKRLEKIEGQKTAPPAPAPKPTKTQVPVKQEKTAAPAPKQAVKTSEVWKLRSAQPGKALISEKGSSDYRTVKAGDTVPGIGKITDISIEDGQWVVRGTKGLITQ